MNEADELGVQGRKVKKDGDLEVTFHLNLLFQPFLFICMLVLSVTPFFPNTKSDLSILYELKKCRYGRVLSLITRWL